PGQTAQCASRAPGEHTVQGIETEDAEERQRGGQKERVERFAKRPEGIVQIDIHQRSDEKRRQSHEEREGEATAEARVTECTHAGPDPTHRDKAGRRERQQEDSGHPIAAPAPVEILYPASATQRPVTPKRRVEGVPEAVKTRIPGLREGVPEAKEVA